MCPCVCLRLESVTGFNESSASIFELLNGKGRRNARTITYPSHVTIKERGERLQRFEHAWKGGDCAGDFFTAFDDDKVAELWRVTISVDAKLRRVGRRGVFGCHPRGGGELWYVHDVDLLQVKGGRRDPGLPAGFVRVTWLPSTWIGRP